MTKRNGTDDSVRESASDGSTPRDRYDAGPGSGDGQGTPGELEDTAEEASRPPRDRGGRTVTGSDTRGTSADPTDLDDWHARELTAVYSHLDTSPSGLTRSDARERLDRFGPNEIQDIEGASLFRVFLEQFSSALIWILVAAAVVMAAVGHLLDATVIAGIVVVITLFGFVQDYRAERSIQALKDMSTKRALVWREGVKTEVDARTVVPGDIIQVSSGNIVPADARLVSASDLRLDESALTGESMGVSKTPGVTESDTPLAERTNMVFKDTIVEHGSGVAVVVETGSRSEVGQIATALETAEHRSTPFQAEMDRLGKLIALGVLAVVSIISISELVLGNTPPLEVFLTAVGVAVSAVPEGLPAVVTLSLALGARRMADRNALVRRLPVVEALGSVDVICTDKTGTLTEGQMTVTRLYANGDQYEVTGTGYDTDGEIRRDRTTAENEVVRELLRCGMLCNDVDIGSREFDRSASLADSVHGSRPGVDGETDSPDRTYIGDPTEIALFVAARKAGLDHDSLDDQYPRIDELQFTSSRKRMTTLHRTPEGGRIAYTKGAPETVIERCDRELVDGEAIELTDQRREELVAESEGFAGDALRVMAFAYHPDPPPEATESLEEGMVLLGLQGMLDPARPEVPGAIEGCQRAGIGVVMITGDNAVTAKAIGEQVGIDSPRVVTGPQLDDMSDEELSRTLTEVDVFARTSPEHKTRVLQTLQREGHTVAMTGDGVNDAPAVKNADVGIAMGIRGTDVTEQSSDIVLLDDNFATIRMAVSGGRRIFDNVRKFVNYLLSGNGGEVTMIFTGTIAGLGLVITPIQILWINLVTDGLPALSLGVDPPADDVMDRPPRPSDEGVITSRIAVSIVGIALFMTVCLLPLFSLNYTGEFVPGWDVTNAVFGWSPGYDVGRELAQTMVFTGFVVMETIRIQAIRYRYGLGLLTNRWLVGSIVVSLSLHLLVLYTPTGQLLFDTRPLGLVHWLQIALSAVVFAVLMALFAKLQDQYFERY